jgi:hypothetical protein
LAISLGDRLETDLVAVGSEGGTGACNGDSGGPLLVKTKDGPWQLAAIASFVLGDCGSGFSMSTSLHQHRNWITGHLYPQFTQWSEERGISPVLAEDLDGDGLGSFGEFAFGSQPDDPTSNASSAYTIDSPYDSLISHPPSFTIRKRNASEVEITVQSSHDLKEWQSESIESEVKTSDTEVQAVKICVMRDQGKQRHFRFLARPSAMGSPMAYRSGPAYFYRGALFEGLPARDQRREKEFYVTGIEQTTLVLRSEAFDPVLEVYDAGRNVLLFSAGKAGVSEHRVPRSVAKQDLLRIVITSIQEEVGNKEYTFHYPEIPRPPGFLLVNREMVNGVLDSRSDFDGNFFSQQFQIIGATPGQRVTVTLESDPAAGGFHPFLVVLNSMNETIVQTVQTPDETVDLRWPEKWSQR